MLPTRAETESRRSAPAGSIHSRVNIEPGQRGASPDGRDRTGTPPGCRSIPRTAIAGIECVDRKAIARIGSTQERRCASESAGAEDPQSPELLQIARDKMESVPQLRGSAQGSARYKTGDSRPPDTEIGAERSNAEYPRKSERSRRWA